MAKTVASSSRPTRSNRESGISMQMLVPGAFYQCVQPGGFGCSLTGIHIPGPRAILDGTTKRVITALTDVPEPVQIPHKKLVIEISESGKIRKEVEKDFNEADEQPVHEALQLALATEIIRMVSQEEMQEIYPETWEARDEHLVWRHENTSKKVPLLELLQSAQDDNALMRVSQNHKNVEQTKAEIGRRTAATTTPANTEDAPPKPTRPPKPGTT